MSGAQLPRLRVECHAGYRSDEEPRRFFFGEREVAIETIIDRWLDPNHRYFKVRGSDGDIYILRHGLCDDRWELTMHDSDRRDGHRLSST